MKNIIKSVVASIFALAIFTNKAQLTPLVLKETAEDKKEAVVDMPERVPSGPEVATIIGNQLTPGSLPRDFAINQEIYNDRDKLVLVMTEVMEMLLNVGINPSIKNPLLAKMSNLITLINNLGIRYKIRESTAFKTQQIRDIMNEIQNGPREPNASTILSPFMLLKARLEVILSELTNALYTKLVR